MVSEITVIIKNEEKKFISKFLIYHAFSISEDDATIIDCVEQTIKDFGENEVDSVELKISLKLE